MLQNKLNKGAGTDAIKLALFFRKVLHEMECAAKGDIESLRKDASNQSYKVEWKSKHISGDIFLSTDTCPARA